MIKAATHIVKYLCLSACLVILFYSSSSGQCSALTLQSLTYDTLIAGTGNTNHTFSFAKFDPALGTLVSAKINSVVSVNYGFTLQNVETVPRDFTVKVGRIDNFSSTALVTPYNNQISTNLGSFLLNPSDSVTKPLSTIIYRYVNTDSITTDVANFIGSGAVSFDYEPITYTTLFGSVNYYYTASANDTIHFSMTYQFCNNVALASALNSFNANKLDWQTVNLDWRAVNEQPGRNYDIQESNDGNNFVDAGFLPSVMENNGESHYTYRYNTQGTQNGLLYFRLKIMNASGVLGYSEVKTVNMGGDETGLPILYPNPSDQFINIVFNQPGYGNWQIDLFAANGSILERKNFMNVNTAHIDFQHALASGVYFARLTNLQTQKNQVLSFVVAK